MGIEHFIPKTLIEPLNEGVLIGLARLDKTQRNAVFLCPLGKELRG
jgi:hypothetical protein